MAGTRSPGLTSAARRPESIISVMPATPHVERREASAFQTFVCADRVNLSADARTLRKA